MGYNTDQKSKHYLYPTYNAMMNRCYNPRNPAYADYGGRGITVCEAWIKSFWQFVQDVGERPAKRTLDRKNNNGNYEPNNIRWATTREQLANRKR